MEKGNNCNIYEQFDNTRKIVFLNSFLNYVFALRLQMHKDFPATEEGICNTEEET